MKLASRGFSIIVLLLAVCALSIACSTNGNQHPSGVAEGHELAWPGSDWEASTPEAEGIDPAAVEFAGNGYGGQFVPVAPEFDVVCVFNGWNIHDRPEKSTYRALQERILPTIKP